jgi:hypothetical protein
VINDAEEIGWIVAAFAAGMFLFRQWLTKEPKR